MSKRKVSMTNVALLILFAAAFMNEKLYAKDAHVESEGFFQMSLEELFNVKITTANKRIQKVYEIPASVVVVTRQEIQKKGYTSFFQLISNVAGYYGLDSNAQGGQIYGVRGYWTGNSRNVKFLINGEDTVIDNNGNYGSTGRNPPVEAIERIEIIRGPMAVIYGSGAMFGVINIITSSIEVDKVSTSASVHVGTGGKKRAVLRLTAAGELGYDNVPLSVTVNLSHDKENGIERPWDDFIYKNNINNYLLSSEPSDQRSDAKLSAEHTYADSSFSLGNWKINLIYDGERDGIILAVPTVGDGSQAFVQRFIGSIKYSKQVTDKHILDLKAGISNYTMSVRSRGLYRSLWGSESTESRAFFLEVDSSHIFSEKMEASFGYAYRQVSQQHFYWNYPSFGLINVNRLEPGEKREKHGLYGQANLKLSDKFIAVIGGRFDQEREYKFSKRTDPELPTETFAISGNDDDGWTFIPRMALLYHESAKHHYKLLYSEAINMPGFFQRTDAVGYSPLVNEEIITYEFVYEGILTDKIKVNSSLFRNDTDKLTTRISEIDLSTEQYLSHVGSVGSLETYGIELGIISKPISRLGLDASITYQKSEDKRSGFDNIDVAYSPEVLANFALTYEQNNALSYSLTGRYRSKMLPGWQGDAETGSRVSDIKGKGFSTFDLSARWHPDVFEKNMKISLAVTNLLDEDGNDVPTESMNWADRGIPREERRVELGLLFEY